MIGVRLRDSLEDRFPALLEMGLEYVTRLSPGTSLTATLGIAVVALFRPTLAISLPSHR